MFPTEIITCTFHALVQTSSSQMVQNTVALLKCPAALGSGWDCAVIYHSLLEIQMKAGVVGAAAAGAGALEPLGRALAPGLLLCAAQC